MDWKKKLLSGSNLYLILDAQVNDYKQLLQIALQSVRSGVDFIQVRDKNGTAKEVMNFSELLIKQIGNRVPVIINDRVDISLALGAAGVHLGQEDMPLSFARRILGHNKIIGISCQTIDQARKAQNEGADYIGFGSVFKTQTKPERNPMNLGLLQDVVSEINIPLFVIGGINLTNVESLLARGVANFAVCRAISTAENIEAITKSFKSLITHDNKILR